MRDASRWLFALVVWAFVIPIGCALKTEHKIEAHITIDIRQIRETLSSIEDEVSGGSPPPSPAAKPGSFLWRGIAEAYAQGTALTPEAERAKAGRKARYAQIQELKSQGVVGENNQGLLTVRGEASSDVEGLVRAENADRDVIYGAIVQQSGASVEEIGKVRREAAAGYRDRAQSGEWVQMPDGQWIQK